MKGPWSPLLGLALFLLLALLGGCLEAPGIEDRWTRCELLASEISGDEIGPGATLDLSLAGRITFRAIHTGFLAAELRYADSLFVADYPLDAGDDAVSRSRQVASLLAATTPLGGDARAVTGFDQLIMEVDLGFSATLPADYDPDRGLWLALYFGEGEELRRQGMADTLVVTPVDFEAEEILVTGLALPGGGS